MRKVMVILIVVVMAGFSSTACGSIEKAGNKIKPTSYKGRTYETTVGGTVTIKEGVRHVYSFKLAVTVDKVVPHANLAGTFESGPSKPGTYAYAVHLTIKNVGKDSYNLDLGDNLTLVGTDVDGKRVEDSFPNDDLEVKAGPSFEFIGKLVPGGLKKGYVVFEVGDQVKIKKISYGLVGDIGVWRVP